MSNEDHIDITGLPKHEVFRALFNNSKQQGMGFLDGSGATAMTQSDAQEICDRTLDFDYVRGRVMKVRLEKDQFFPGLYDRDNGQGAAARAVDSVR